MAKFRNRLIRTQHYTGTLSSVDQQLIVEDVCAMFGQHVKFSVTLAKDDESDTAFLVVSPLRNAFTVTMASQRACREQWIWRSYHLKFGKETRTSYLVSFFESKRWEWNTGGGSHGQQFITQLQESLWYIDGHHQTFADRYHPIPSLFEGFSGYNTPELSKHQKRSHTNLNADTLRSYARSLKGFLLCPWMKKQGWATIRIATEDLAEAMESYALELIKKNWAVQKHNETRMEVASDDLAFIVINAKDDHPILLNGIVGELQTKITSPFLFVILPQLTGISGICTSVSYTHLTLPTIYSV